MEAKQIIEKIEAIGNLRGWMAQKLVDYLCSVDDNAYTAFFNSFSKCPLPDRLSAYTDDVKALSRMYISRVISEVMDYQVCSMVRARAEIEKDLDQWFSERNQTLGEALAAERLRAELPEAFAAPQTHAEALADILTSRTFVNGMAVYCDQDPNHQQPLRLLWLMMKQLDEKKWQQVTEAWSQTEYKPFTDAFASFGWLDAVKEGMSSGTSSFNQVKEAVRAACDRETETAREHKSKVVGTSTMGVPIVSNYDLVTYTKGVAVTNWIRQSGYASGGQASFPSQQKEEYGKGGCVLRGTKLLTEHRDYIAIEDLPQEAWLLSEKKCPSLYAGERICNAHVNRLYAINEDKPFMSLDHMILTTQGYKCLAPEEAHRINPRVSVSMLKVNDVVVKYKLDEQNHLIKEYEPVRQINIAGNSELCMDIHIADGYKSYITDKGYVCYANYPEITSKSIGDTLAKSKNYFADHDFRRAFKAHRKELAEAFGEVGVSYVEQMVNRSPAKGRVALISHSCSDILLNSLDMTDIQVYGERDRAPSFSRLHIIRGHLLFDEDYEDFTKFTVKDGHIYWKRLLKTGETERGMLRMYGNGFYGHGITVTNGVPVRFYTASTNIYKMKLTQKDGGERDCGTFETGYKNVGGKFVIIGNWSMSYKDMEGREVMGLAASSENSDISYYVDNNHHLACKVQFSGLALKQFDTLRLSGMEKSALTFDAVFENISGSAVTVKDNQDEEIGEITGVLNPQTAKKIHALSASLARKHISDGIKSAELSEKDMRTVQAFMEKSVLDLYNLPQPENMGDVHSECFDKMLKMAAHAAYSSGDEVSRYIGIARPTVDDATGDITRAQAKIAEDYKSFFVDGLALAYMSYSYSKSTDQKISAPITAVPGYENKIKYYMQGKDQGCMCTDQGYQTATNNLYKLVYAANVPGLSEYVNEQSQKDWALQLYKYCTEPAILNGLIMTNLVDPDNSRINHLCTVLDVLDDSERVYLEAQTTEGDDTKKKFSFSAALRKQVTDLAFKYIFKNIKLPDKEDREAVEAFNATIVSFLETYFKNLNNHAFTNWTADIYQEAQKDLEEAAKAAGYESTQAYINDIADIVADTTAAILSLKDPDMPSRIVAFFSNHPTISRCITMGFYVTGISTLILGFTSWSSLTDTERAELIGSTAAIGLTAINDVAVWRACGVFKQTYGDLTAADSAITASITEADFTKAFAGSKDIETALTKLGVDMGQVTSEEADIMASASKWMNISRITGVAAKVSSVLMMAAALGFQIYETVQDFKSGQPAAVEAMDIIQDISCGVCFLAEAGAGVAALCGVSVCSAVPVVGVVFAVVGIVAAIVTLFLHRKEPLSPIEQFIQERCVPFVKNALDPPQEWIDQQKNIDSYLDDKGNGTLKLQYSF